MAKPVINKVIPFDATKDYVVSASYSGNMPYQNRLIIYEAKSLDKIFDETIDSFQLRHTIPANTLTNGVKYAMQIQFFDQDGVASSLSDKYYFKPLSTPQFYFSNITDGMEVDSASITANVTYIQTELEELLYFKFQLCNSLKQELYSTEDNYDTAQLSYTYKGLDDDTVYYLRCTGMTYQGIEVDTGYYKIEVDYENEDDYARLYVNCNNRNSAMNYHTNFILIDPTRDNYQYDGSWILLDNDVLTYNSGFVFPNDFTIRITGRKMCHDGIILKCSNGTFTFTLQGIVVGDGEFRYKLLVPNGMTNYCLYSKPLYITDDDIVTIFIRRINNVYGLYCYDIQQSEFLSNYWFGQSIPSSFQSEEKDIWIDTDEDTVRVLEENMDIRYVDELPEDAELHAIWVGGEMT